MNAPVNTRRLADALAHERLLAMVVMAFAMFNPGKPPLKASWYLRAMCYWLERVERRELPRSMIWIQPRTLKSITVAIVFPCWLLGRNPNLEIMVATYGETLSREHAERRREILESDWYRRLFPATRIDPRSNRLLHMKTTAGGAIRSVSVGGPVTGRGADIIILDDCMKADELSSDSAREGVKNWYSASLSSRLNNKAEGAIVSIQQRLHEDDLPAHLLAKGFACLSLPAICEEDCEIELAEGLTHKWKRGELLDSDRFPTEVLESQRLELGPQAYSAQYLQNPVAPEGNLLKMEWFRRFETPLPRERFDRVVQSWDPAATDLPTSDWSVCTTWGYLAGRVFLLDIFRQRLDYPGLKRAVMAQRRKWRADSVIIERSSNGLPLVQQLLREGPFKPNAWPPKGSRQLDKAERLLAQTGQIEEGRVWLPASLDGLGTFLNELRAFPNGRYDDQVDTLTQMLEFLFWRWKSFHEERTAEGRLKAPVRGKRPPLPPLPDWIK